MLAEYHVLVRVAEALAHPVQLLDGQAEVTLTVDRSLLKGGDCLVDVDFAKCIHVTFCYYFFC